MSSIWRHRSAGRNRRSVCRRRPLLEYNGPFTLHRVVLQTSRTPVDRLFRAFSDRTRLRILHLLQQGELCVCDLAESASCLPSSRLTSKPVGSFRGCTFPRGKV